MLFVFGGYGDTVVEDDVEDESCADAVEAMVTVAKRAIAAMPRSFLSMSGYLVPKARYTIGQTLLFWPLLGEPHRRFSAVGRWSTRR
jgi:hypothetical protein